MLLAVEPSGRPALAQQVASNRANAYLFPTNVQDVRAIWVNPAGLGVLREASIYGEGSVGDPTSSSAKLRQFNAGFNTRGLSFAWQHDVLDNGVHGNTYRLGLAGGSQGLAAGVAIARYTGGGAKGTGWDVGGLYAAKPSLTLGLVAANIGQPIVRGLQQRFTLTPGLTWQPAQSFNFSAAGRLATDSVESYSFGVSWRSGGPTTKWPVGILARLDTDGGWRRAGFAFGFAIGSQDRIGLVATTPGDVSSIEDGSLYGVSSRLPAAGRH